MSWRFISNKVNGKSTIHVLGSSGNIVVVGNSTTSNLTSNSSEVISEAYIRNVTWGASSNSTVRGQITVLRGANIIFSLTETGELKLDGLAITLDSTANIDVQSTFTSGFCILEIDKKFSVMSTIGGY